jgi:hypothetical protein
MLCYTVSMTGSKNTAESMVRCACLLLAAAAGIAAVCSCKNKMPEPVLVKYFPVNDLEGVITQSHVKLDKKISYDGKGSIRIRTKKPLTVRLYEVRGLEEENARLTYQAKLRSAKVKGKAFLELWCHFPGHGEFFSRGLQTPLTGTTEWTTEETHFFLKGGEKPDFVKLNVVIEGSGIVWVDEIRLLKTPL